MKTIEYTTPELEIIEIEVEAGFAASSNQEPSPWEEL